MPGTLPPAVEQSQPYHASRPIARSAISGSIRSGRRLIPFSLRGLELTDARRIRLVLRGLQKTKESLVLRVTVASAPSVRLIAGNLYTYGEGAAAGSKEGARFFPLTLSLDITDTVRQLAGAEQVDAYLDILDPHGRVLTNETLYLETVEIDIVEPR